MPTTGFRAFLAPRLTPLKEHLLDRIAADPLAPREFEWLFVQSRGMRHWLTLQIAERFTCAASLKLPFPRDLITSAARWVNIRMDGSEHFTREALLWRVEHRLRTLDLDQPTFAPLKTFLSAADARMRAGLASRIADRLDDYQLFRPELLATWDRGEHQTDSPHEGWQAALWHELAIGEVAYPARIADRVLRKLKDATPGTFNIPRRLTIFGVSSLPERFIEFLDALGRHTDVTLYAALLPQATDHPLVRAWGAQGTAMQELLTRHGATIEYLETITAPTIPLSARVQCHSTHGPLREIEVIRDQLLDAFEHDPTLTPDQVLVLVPDVESWGPTVETVFSSKDPGAPAIPFHIADRPLKTDPAMHAFSELLALERGRLAHSELFAALQHPMVRAAVDLNEEALEALGRRTLEANVRWGYDASALATLQLPATDMPTWREGLDRLLMGIVAGASDHTVLRVLPTAGATAGDPEALGKLTGWVERVAGYLADWQRPRSLSEWSDTLVTIVEQYLKGTDSKSRGSRARLIAHLRRIVSDHPAGIERDGTPIDFGVIREWLGHTLADDAGSPHFLTGNVTIAAMKPMRSIPFRVIAIAGLEDANFPRRDRPVSFDLVAHTRRSGDRSVREDDRQLFLDLMMAAEDRLILTWSGHEPSTHVERACSVVIDELLDHHERRGTPISVVQHPLHPFSRRYFSAAAADVTLFTFSHALAQATVQPQTASDVFAPVVIDPAILPSASEEVRLDDLIKCWENPAKWFCQRMLQLRLLQTDLEEADHERFALHHLQAGLIKSQIIRRTMAEDETLDHHRMRLLADGALPPGALGCAWYSTLAQEVAGVQEAVRPLRTRSAAIMIQGNGWFLRCTLDGIMERDRIIVRAGDFHPKNRISAWIEHVVLCAAAQSGHLVPRLSTLIGIGPKAKRAAKRGGTAKPSTHTIEEVPNAIALLDRWVQVLRDARTRPLPFFPKAGAGWLDARCAEADDAPILAALDAYRTGDFSEGDDNDPYIALCFRGLDPVIEQQASFETLASTLCPDFYLPSLP